MSEVVELGRKRGNDAVKWIISSGLVAALLSVWATLFGLLFRTGWLTTFGVDPDHFLPASASELTLWSYLALIQTWGDANSKVVTALLWSFGVALLGIGLGISIALLARRFEQKVSSLRASLHVQATLDISTWIGMITLAPVALVAIAAVLLFPPMPAYFLGKNAAAKAVSHYQVAERRGCQTLSTTAGPIGNCPMVIAQTTERIAFLDGDLVRIVPAAGVEVSWKMPEVRGERLP